MDDARIAVQCGVQGVDVVIGTSSFLMERESESHLRFVTCTHSATRFTWKGYGIHHQDSHRSHSIRQITQH